jgi:gamma-glutamyltranspeptidase/glutathione hydrolase
VVLACDARGLIAALAYTPARAGIEVPGLEVSLGRSAIPVRRGVTRVAPGTLLPALAPLAVAVQRGGFAVAVGVPGRALVAVADVAALARGAGMETALAELRDKVGARTALAVLTDGKTARAALV